MAVFCYSQINVFLGDFLYKLTSKARDGRGSVGNWEAQSASATTRDLSIKSPISTPVMGVTQDTAHRRTTESYDMSCPHCIGERNWDEALVLILGENFYFWRNFLKTFKKLQYQKKKRENLLISKQERTLIKWMDEWMNE